MGVSKLSAKVFSKVN